MAKQLIDIVSFKAGEITEYLDIRTDLDYYSSAGKEIKNVIVWQHGGVTRRPGTKLIQDLSTIPVE